MTEKLPIYLIQYDPEKKKYLPGEIKARLNALGQRSDPILIDHDTADLSIDHPEFFEVKKRVKVSAEPLLPYETAFHVKLKKELVNEPKFLEQFKNPIKATIKARAKALGDGVPGEFKYRQISIQVEGFELVIRAKQQGQREYGGVKLNENEFVADTHDALEFEIFARCKDREADVVVGLEEEIDVVLEGPDTNRYKKKIEKIPDTRKWSLKIFAFKPLLYEGTEDGQKITLKVKGRVKLSEGNIVQLIAPTKELRSRFVFLKLWVVPGVRQGQSEAGAICCVAPDSSQLLDGVPLALWVKKVNDFGMPGYGVRLEQVTNNGTTTSDDLKTDRLGTVKWKLAYRDLKWETLDFAQFEVKCGIVPSADAFGWKNDGNNSKPRPVTCTSVNVDVRQNVITLLTDFNAALPGLDLKNPFFESDRWLMESKSWIFRDWLRGPAWNFSLFFDTLNQYSCHSMRDRIFNWLKNRRRGFAGEKRGKIDPKIKKDKIDPDLMASMNGIEICTYAMQPIHVFAGFHLSGTKPDEEPKFFDPWWRQQSVDILTWKEELARLIYTIGLSSLLIIIGAKIMVLTSPIAGSAAERVGLGALPRALTRLKAWLSGTRLGVVGKIGSKGLGIIVGGGATSYVVGGYTFVFGADPKDILDGDLYQYARDDWLMEVALEWQKGSPHKLPAVAPIDIW